MKEQRHSLGLCYNISTLAGTSSVPQLIIKSFVGDCSRRLTGLSGRWDGDPVEEIEGGVGGGDCIGSIPIILMEMALSARGSE